MRILREVLSGLFTLAVIGVFVLLLLFQAMRRQAEIEYPFTVLSFVAIILLLFCALVAIFAKSIRPREVWFEFVQMSMHDRIQSVTSLGTAMIVIFGIVFAAARYDQARFVGQLEETERTNAARQAVRLAEDFNIRAAREFQLEMSGSFSVDDLNKSEIVANLVSGPEIDVFYSALGDAQYCIRRRECNPASLRQNMCDATESLAKFERRFPSGRWDDDPESRKFRELVDYSSRAVVSHCSFPQAAEHVWRFFFDRS